MRDLLLIRIENQEYGIWKDEIASVKDIQNLHRLPLSPECIAGISIIDDRTVTLADLRVCIGYAQKGASGKGRVLVLPGQEKMTAFMISEDAGSLAVSDDAVFPIPDYLKTDVIDSCAVRDVFPIPIINVLKLSSRLLKTNEELPRGEFTVPRRETDPAIPAVRVFEIQGEAYAVSAAGLDEQSVEPGRLARLALVPRYVNGIAFYRGTIMPVIDLSQRIKRQKAAANASLLIADIAGTKFGLLADADRGTVPLHDLSISDLPPLARTSSMRSALLTKGGVVPLLDLVALLNANGKDAGDDVLVRYTPDSQFDSVLKRQDVDVVEFLLLGTRHALPRSEVEDIIPLQPCREMPDVPEIVVGVLEHQGVILPVLDLAMIFGRRSLATREWQMLLVKNGDFRAFVITEAVFGERRLPLAIQRDVPILLPHKVVYGCYPEAEAVRLILNVESIAVHFEKSLVKELLPALSSEMKQAAAVIVPSLLDQDADAGIQADGVAEVQARSEETAATAESSPAASPVPENGPGEPVQAKTEETTGKKQEEISQEERKTGPQQIIEEVREQEPAAIRHETVDRQEIISGAAAETGLSTSETQAKAEELKAGEAAAAPEETAVEETAAAVGTGYEEVKEEAAPDVPADAGREQESGEEAPVTAIEGPAGEDAPVEPVEEPVFERPPFIGSVPDEPAPSLGAEPETASVPHQPEQKPEPMRAAAYAYQDSRPELPNTSWKRTVGIGAIVGVLILLLYFVTSINKPGVEKPVKEALPAKAEPVKAEPKPQPPAPKPEPPPPPLVLDVPRERPVTIDVYVVVKDDTLWSISERFTGNPFNYPRIAGENRIANPDLIFPGQRIRLKKK